MFRIKTLRIDDEHDMQIRVAIKGEFCSSSLDIWIAGKEVFKNFAEELKAFPFNGKKELEFVYGEDNSMWTYYLRIGIKIFDQSGKSFVHVIMVNKGDQGDNYRCEFPINTDIQTLNKLGQKLSEWRPVEGEIWIFE